MAVRHELQLLVCVLWRAGLRGGLRQQRRVDPAGDAAADRAGHAVRLDHRQGRHEDQGDPRGARNLDSCSIVQLFMMG